MDVLSNRKLFAGHIAIVSNLDSKNTTQVHYIGGDNPTRHNVHNTYARWKLKIGLKEKNN